MGKNLLLFVKLLKIIKMEGIFSSGWYTQLEGWRTSADSWEFRGDWWVGGYVQMDQLWSVTRGWKAWVSIQFQQPIYIGLVFYL